MSDESLCKCCRPPRFGAECLALRECRMSNSAEGRRQLREAYCAQLAKAVLARDATDAPKDVSSRLSKCGFPVQAIGAMREPKPTPALFEAKRFIADRLALFLLLLGDKGVGKTVAATYVGWDYARHWDWDSTPSGTTVEPLMFAHSGAMTRLSAFDAEDTARLGRMETARLLVVDDMGDEGTDLGRGTLVDMLLRRCARGRRTVLTSNLRKEPFKKRYGEALADRVRAQGYILEAAGKSLRGRHGESRP